MNKAAISEELVGRPLSAWQRFAMYCALAGVMALALWVQVARPYSSDSRVGYNLGLVGGCMLLLLLVHPLRKHWSRMHHIGTLRGWFILHLMFGIGGPLLILFHSTFHLRSFNAAVAFWCMMVIMLSGTVGRFGYLRVYRGLGACQASLYEMEGLLDERPAKAVHAFDLAPQAREWLEDYRRAALGARSTWLTKLFRIVFLRGGGRRLIGRTHRQVRQVLGHIAKRERWAALKLASQRHELESLVTEYVRTVETAMRYSFWERTLAWWHVAHGPLVYVFVLSAVAHVVAVHIY